MVPSLKIVGELVISLLTEAFFFKYCTECISSTIKYIGEIHKLHTRTMNSIRFTFDYAFLARYSSRKSLILLYHLFLLLEQDYHQFHPQ